MESRTWRPLLIALIPIAFVAWALPPYLTFDSTRSRIPVSGVSAYYLLLVAHVAFASVAMVTACAQVWPWLRNRHPAIHRAVGRVYVFAGVLPAGAAGLVLGAMSPFGPMIRVSNVLLAILWLTCTLVGYRMGRLRRFAMHRRWMIRSVVLTMSIITNRVWAVIFFLALSPQLQTTFGGNEQLMVQAIAGLSGWLGWVLPLLVTEWWFMERSAVGTSPIGRGLTVPETT